ALFRMKGRERDGKPQWLLVKKKDSYADENWELVQREPGGARPRRSARAEARRDHERRISKSTAVAGEAVSPDAFLKKRALEGNLALGLGRDQVEITSLDKPYWPDEGYAKGDLIRYYLEIGKYIMPYLKDRPAILKRYPNGISAEPFFQHNVESAPVILKTE